MYRYQTLIYSYTKCATIQSHIQCVPCTLVPCLYTVCTMYTGTLSLYSVYHVHWYPVSIQCVPCTLVPCLYTVCTMYTGTLSLYSVYHVHWYPVSIQCVPCTLVPCLYTVCTMYTGPSLYTVDTYLNLGCLCHHLVSTTPHDLALALYPQLPPVTPGNNPERRSLSTEVISILFAHGG